MQRRKRLSVDLEQLCYALDDSSYEHSYYLDLETGEPILISNYMDPEDADRLREQVDNHPDRYEPLPKADSYEGYQEMEDFIASVEDEHIGQLLEVAIDGKGAFRRFKEVLTRYPEEQERWFRFKDDRLNQRALEWLEEIGVEPL